MHSLAQFQLMQRLRFTRLRNISTLQSKEVNVFGNISNVQLCIKNIAQLENHLPVFAFDPFFIIYAQFREFGVLLGKWISIGFERSPKSASAS